MKWHEMIYFKPQMQALSVLEMKRCRPDQNSGLRRN